jgi:hypothetical protein
VDGSLWLNVTTVLVSVAALVVSSLIAARQVRLAAGGNHLPVVLEAFQQTRSPAWLEAQEYVLNDLAAHPADHGHRGLPEHVRRHTTTIGLFYDDLGKTVAHGMIDQRLVIGGYGTTIVRLWDALAPYVYAERRLHGLHFWVYFEDLAVRTAATTPEAVYRALGLRSRPPGVTNDAGPDGGS